MKNFIKKIIDFIIYLLTDAIMSFITYTCIVPFIVIKGKVSISIGITFLVFLLIIASYLPEGYNIIKYIIYGIIILIIIYECIHERKKYDKEIIKEKLEKSKIYRKITNYAKVKKINQNNCNFITPKQAETEKRKRDIK